MNTGGISLAEGCPRASSAGFPPDQDAPRLVFLTASLPQPDQLGWPELVSVYALSVFQRLFSVNLALIERLFGVYREN